MLKNMKILIDANVILRYLLNDVEEMSKKSAEIINAGAFTLPEVIAEVIYVLKSVYKVEREEIAAAILQIFNEIEVANKKILIEAVKIFAESSLDFVDCILIAYNKVENVEIFTFDKKLYNRLKK